MIIGKGQQTAAATLVERTTRFVSIKALPKGKDSVALTDILIENFNELPTMMRKSLTWDQGSEMAGHAALTLAADLPGVLRPPQVAVGAADEREHCEYLGRLDWAVESG